MNEEKKNNSKTLSRLAAVQAVYLFDLGITKIQNNELKLENYILDVIAHYDQEQHIDIDNEEKISTLIKGKINKKFMSNIAFTTYNHINEIDKLLTDNLIKHDNLGQLSLLLRAILRCAVGEMKYCDTPKKVVIDEYVKLTKDFYNDPEVNFTNAILDKIAKETHE